MAIVTAPMEDELGDVLEKALRYAELTEDELAARSGVSAQRIADAIDYRSDLTCDELRSLAGILRLNEVGFCALGCGRYPLPQMPALPFCVYPLRMPHGIGVANAYVVADGATGDGILFDAGPRFGALAKAWPESVKRLHAAFLTHVEPEHAGGLCEVVERFGLTTAYCPEGSRISCGKSIAEGERCEFPQWTVRAFSTPGHASSHNCYLVESTTAAHSSSLLISGDLLFAGSVGGAHFCRHQLLAHVGRLLKQMPLKTVIAPGHGPMTTVEHERRFNPFAV